MGVATSLLRLNRESASRSLFIKASVVAKSFLNKARNSLSGVRSLSILSWAHSALSRNGQLSFPLCHSYIP